MDKSEGHMTITSYQARLQIRTMVNTQSGSRVVPFSDAMETSDTPTFAVDASPYQQENNEEITLSEDLGPKSQLAKFGFAVVRLRLFG